MVRAQPAVERAASVDAVNGRSWIGTAGPRDAATPGRPARPRQITVSTVPCAGTALAQVDVLAARDPRRPADAPVSPRQTSGRAEDARRSCGQRPDGIEPQSSSSRPARQVEAVLDEQLLDRLNVPAIITGQRVAWLFGSVARISRQRDAAVLLTVALLEPLTRSSIMKIRVGSSSSSRAAPAGVQAEHRRPRPSACRTYRP